MNPVEPPANGNPPAPPAASFQATPQVIQDRNAAFNKFKSFKGRQGFKKVTTAAVGALAAVGITTATATSASFPQFIEDGQCSMDGGNGPGGAGLADDKIAANDLKNRYIAPEEDEIDRTVTEKMFTTEGPPDPKTGKSANLDQSKGADVEGYVFKIKSGGAETCNCKSPDQKWYDTHIYLSPDGKATKLSDCFIVEITPRFRLAGLSGNVSKSTEDLIAAFPPGTHVEVTGWQFYDREHEPNALAIHPDNPKAWRSTCWEIHPVTDISIVAAGATNGKPQPSKPVVGPRVAPAPNGAIVAPNKVTTPKGGLPKTPKRTVSKPKA
jgi:hypothetical protein